MASGKIFISYRRSDSQWAAARLYDHLAHAFPDGQIFMDVERIAPGQDFVDVLSDQVGGCDVFLALIGADWLNAAGERGRRLDDPDDFVRVEIASALAREETVTIPVLLDGAPPPNERDLPEDLKPLARRQFARLTHEGFRGEAAGLTQAVRAAIGGEAEPRPRRTLRIPWRALGGAAGAGALVAAGVWAWSVGLFDDDPADLPDLARFVECETCPEMIVLPAGDVLLGSPEDEANRSSSEGPRKRATIPRFALARTEMTALQYAACVEDGACAPLPQVDRPAPDTPATNVTLTDAEAYVAWLNGQVRGEPYHVPSEAQWEYAARAGTETAYPWGEDWDRAYGNMGRVVCCIGHAEGPDEWEGAAPVGRFRPNAWGLHDMAGNLEEWTADTYESGHEHNPGDGSAYIAAAQLAVDGQIEERKITGSSGEFQSNADCPNVFWQQRTFLSDEAAFVPGGLRWAEGG